MIPQERRAAKIAASRDDSLERREHSIRNDASTPTKRFKDPPTQREAAMRMR